MTANLDLSQVHVFTTPKRDDEVAAELRTEVRPHLEAIATLQNRAMKAGLTLGFQLARDQFGRNFVQSIDVVKPL